MIKSATRSAHLCARDFHSEDTLRFLGLLLAIGASVSSAQVITTVAGTSWLPPASGIAAANAPLGGPSGVALDASGNIYIADSADHVVERISPFGVLTIVAGNGKGAFAGDGGPAVNASLNRPWSVAIDSSGNLYIADSANNRVRKVSNGIITTVAGNGRPRFFRRWRWGYGRGILFTPRRRGGFLRQSLYRRYRQ